MPTERQITLTAGNIRRGHFYIPRGSNLFPADAWGGKNETEAALPVLWDFSGISEKVSTDIDGDKRIPRNARGQCSRFFKHYSLKAGDQIVVTATGPRRFRIEPAKSASLVTPVDAGLPAGSYSPERSEAVILRIVRDSQVSVAIKRLYDNRCQVCGIILHTKAGPYSEGAHIRPLGSPHNGSDVPGNVLCLCPNHHVMLDGRTLSINDDLTLNGVSGKLRVHPSHNVDMDSLRYQRDDAQPLARGEAL